MQVEDIKYDGEINIAIGLKVTSRSWKNTKTKWSNLVNKLSRPVVTAERYNQFINASKDEQGKIKDVGGFVGGYLTGGKRDKSSVLNRQLITLDVDFSHDNFWWDFTMLYDCAAVIHSTHKSCPESPRHRLIIPLDREVSQEEYQAISRKIAGDLNIDLFDQSTFDVNRLMFWPSISVDAQYYFEFQDGPFLSADYILEQYVDWHDTTEWPTASSTNDVVKQSIDKQEDPEDKEGIVGVFCRTYSIQDAIAKFLPDIYIPAGDGRYTYSKGTTAAGLVVYDDKYAYSHHGTDPAGGRLCNAFDLVRIHLFGHLDSGKEKDGKGSKSYKEMEAFVTQDTQSKKQLAREKLADAKFEFSEEVIQNDEDDTEWMAELETNTKGEYDNSANNLNVIFRHDKVLKDVFKLNMFDNKRYVTQSLPWRHVDSMEAIRDVDYSGVRNYIECIYGIVSSGKVDDALALEFERAKFHPITEYILSLTWDGISRVDTLLIDYFGVEDNSYTRAVIRKTLCGAVARVFEPGIKFDTALIIVGPQATGKSTFVKKLGRKWFSDTFTTVQGKESFEQLQGAWIIEMAELSGLKKAEVETIKHFISKREDSYRPAYGRMVETYKRQCVFFGTTNKSDFLRDPTGNRRFLPVDVQHEHATKSIFADLTDEVIDQIWAEAYVLYKKGESLYLSDDIEKAAFVEQIKHSEADERTGLIHEYLNKKVPAGWDKMDLYERRRWLEDPLAEVGIYRRDLICVAEVWCECLCKDKADMSRYNTREINELLKNSPDWEMLQTTRRFPIYGIQRYFRRRGSLL